MEVQECDSLHRTQGSKHVCSVQPTSPGVDVVDVDILDLTIGVFSDVATQQSSKTEYNSPKFKQILRDLKSCEDAVKRDDMTTSLPRCVHDVAETAQTEAALPRYRRRGSMQAEQRRRKTIHIRLWDLVEVIPSLSHLKKERKIRELDIISETVKCVSKLKAHHKSLVEEIDELKKESTETLQSICDFQAGLPVTGLLDCKKSRPLCEIFNEHVKNRTSQNWMYSIFCMMINPLFKTYKKEVTTRTSEEFVGSLIQWTDARLCLTFLRPVVIYGLRDLVMCTSVMNRPDRLKEEAVKLFLTDESDDR